MCPICWISGFIAVLFGGSFIAVANHPISWVISAILIVYGVYKFTEAKKRGSGMTDEAKVKNARTIKRFLQGVAVGAIVTGSIFYVLTEKEHHRMHLLLEQHGIEKHEH